MGLFAKAAEKKSGQSAKKKKATIWSVSGEAAEKLHEYAKHQSEMKSLKARLSRVKGAVERAAFDYFTRDFANRGIMPETPMKVVNDQGDEATYVVQDRSSQYSLNDEQIEGLKELLGSDAVERLVYDEIQVGFNRDIMAIPGVSEAVEKALEKVITQMTRKGTLDEGQAEELVEVKRKRALKPGTVRDAAMIVGNDQGRLRQLIEILGSSATRYIKG